MSTEELRDLEVGPVESTLDEAVEEAESTSSQVETPTEDRKSRKVGKKNRKSEKKLELLARELKEERKARQRLERRLSKMSGAPERGIETWFRLAARNLYTRRQILDSKAQIVITVNSLVLSVVLGSAYNRLEADPHLAIAIVPLVVANLIAIAFGILATRPTIKSGIFRWDDVASRKAHLMTFDDFYRMNLEDYEKALDSMLTSREFLYGTIKKEIHSLGVDLARRYRHVGRADIIFLFGAVLATVLFGLCHAWY